ncbi:hypothetical protein [Streptomyces sp. NPDC097640]|uniref:hypothetical protein n=1 Tax=Streptomyces sp. NPDC097640 TaxID=3157229 RepID=UPI003330E41A
MAVLNLDESKQYATDYSTDGGRTWVAESSGHCSAMVVAEVLHADELGLPVEVNGPIVTICDGNGVTRWTPTS